jgi:hypothetical protein
MKALSIRQPWADFIVQGKKTLELRSWSVKYRGALAIHASTNIEREACVAHGIDPERVTAGAIIGVVDLVDVVELNARAFEARRAEHLANARFNTTPLFGWQLANPRALPQPRVIRGRMGLFTVPDEWLNSVDAPAHAPEPEPAPPVVEPTWTIRADRPFELRVIPEAKSHTRQTAYGLALFQRVVEPAKQQQALYGEPAELQKVVGVSGSVLRTIADNVLDALRRAGYKPTDLSASRREPFQLLEEPGVRLGLLLLAVKPITKMNRVEAIAHGIRAMTSEEVYYWYSKCTTKATADRAQKALRVLLAGE